VIRYAKEREKAERFQHPTGPGSPVGPGSLVSKTSKAPPASPLPEP
jgi:hypothetical protein